MAALPAFKARTVGKQGREREIERERERERYVHLIDSRSISAMESTPLVGYRMHCALKTPTNFRHRTSSSFRAIDVVGFPLKTKLSLK